MKKSKLMKSIMVSILVGAMIFSGLQSIGAEPPTLKNNTKLREDLKNPERGTTYYVNNVSGNNNWDGLALAWDGNHGPKKTIQAGISATLQSNDEVIVAQGIYQGVGNRDLDFSGKNITVRSSNPENLGVVAATIIDCQGNETNPHRGFIFHSGEGADAVVAGFTIKNGFVNRTQETIYLYTDTSYGQLSYWTGGGAIVILPIQNQIHWIVCTTNPTIKNNIFENNTVYANQSHGAFDVYGGAIFCACSTVNISHNIIKNCTSRCVVKSTPTPYSYLCGGFGGGIGCFNSAPRIQHNLIQDNVAGLSLDVMNLVPRLRDDIPKENTVKGELPLQSSAGPVTRSSDVSTYSGGGAIYLTAIETGYWGADSHIIIENNDIIGNRAIGYGRGSLDSYSTEGGGIYDNEGYSVIVRNNRIIGNSAVVDVNSTNSNCPTYVAEGGGCYIYAGSSPYDPSFFCDNLVAGNVAEVRTPKGQLLKDHQSSGAFGGGMVISLYIYHYFGHNTIVDNAASVQYAHIVGNPDPDDHYNVSYGGGLVVGSMYLLIIHDTIIWNNSVDSTTSTPNGSQLAVYPDGQAEVNYSNVQYGRSNVFLGHWPDEGFPGFLNWGTMNIQTDPLFVRPGKLDHLISHTWTYQEGDYHLQASSPCINRGDPAFNPMPDETDIDGQIRVYNVSGVFYPGCGPVDIGADEFGAPYPQCLGDSNGDGIINWRDIDFFVAAMSGESAWRNMFLPGTPTCPYANNDVNQDGLVNWRDIDPFVALMGTSCPSC